MGLNHRMKLVKIMKLMGKMNVGFLQITKATDFLRMMKKNHTDEVLRFSIPEDETASFLKRKGLRVLDHYNNDEIERNFLSREDGTTSGQITGHFRFVTASPDK